MPIYEFYCADCHTVYQFLSRTSKSERRPACPRCGRPDLERRASSFAVSKGLKEPADDAMPDLEDGRLEKAMEALANEAGSLDEEDPKGAARFLRRLYDTAGLELGPAMNEALRRMEAGEDPEAIEEELGDVFEHDPLAPAATQGVRGLRRRFLPPRVDPELHEL